MQTRSSDSVTVAFLDRELVLQQLERCAALLRQSSDKVRRVILFGSLTTDTYGPGSDADLLILLSSDNRRSIDRIPEYLKAFSMVQIGVDVFPLTEAELQQSLERGNAFLRGALETGVELVDTNAPMRESTAVA